MNFELFIAKRIHFSKKEAKWSPVLLYALQ